MHLEKSFEDIVVSIAKVAKEQLSQSSIHRIHGDCHFGNLIYGSEGLFWVDFDDMLNGPAIQDLWLIVPGTFQDFPREWESLIKGYEDMHTFQHKSVHMIETLRAMRMIHFCGWISKRWRDPAFPIAFPNYGNDLYWNELIQDLRVQLQKIEK